MQIDRLTHQAFLADPRANLGTEDRACADALAPTVADTATSPVWVEDAALDASGVRLRLGGDNAAVALYNRSGTRNTVSNDDVSPDAMAQRYQQALARQRPAAPALSVDASGILVAKPRTAFSTQESDFVALAVSAMRDFRDSAERAKPAGGTEPVAQPSAGLRSGLAHLAARFKAFA